MEGNNLVIILNQLKYGLSQKKVAFSWVSFPVPLAVLPKHWGRPREAGRGTCPGAEGGCPYPAQGQDTLRSVQSDRETLTCTAA